MKLASFRLDGRSTYGVANDKGVIDLGRQLGDRLPDLKSLIASDAFGPAEAIAAGPDVDATLDRISFLPVIPNPGKIICIGHNYEEHRIETEREKSAYPTVFLRYADSQIGHEQPMLCPRESSMLDYEGEIALVIGKGGRRIREDAAWEHVAGYSCYNEGSVRDWQKHTTQFSPGKNFVGTGAFGPWMVTADEFTADHVFSLTTRLNGQVMQQATTDMLIFPFARLIAYCSTFLPLEAGDVIVTGTPGGVGARRNPPVFMRPGDVVEVEVSGIGTLRNRVAQD
ncbi:MAG: fumarylacetoacetate hydrolase family protein [Pseudomonadota bacterium]|nr:fumarylacetoacetate hydrolase family protein [Pseudomonadota bacterium]